VRKDLGAPKMPFVIGVLGVDGLKAKGGTLSFREAMTAPSLMPEFKGNVTAVPTAPFWAEELAVIDEKHAKIRQMEFLLRVKDKNAANKDGTMSAAEQKEYLKKIRGRSHLARRSRALETRRVQRRLSLPRLREDLRAHGQGIR